MMKNYKYYNSFSSKLKFFFERNNKTVNVNSKLGLTFRNSKWVDLSIQNIKISMLTRWTFMFVSFIVLVILIYYVVFNSNYKFSFEIWFNKQFLVDSCADIFCNFSLTLNTFLSSIFLWFFFLFGFTNYESNTLDSFLFKSQNTTNNILSGILNNDEKNIKEVSSGLWVKRAIELKTSLDYTHQSNLCNDYLFTFSKIHELDSLTQTYFSLKYTTPDKTLKYNYYNFINNDKFFVNDNIDFNNFEINNKLFNNVNTRLVNFMLTSKINSIKEERWLLKNSPISRNLSISNNMQLCAKKILENNKVSNNNHYSNVWKSNIFSKNNINLININFFSNSETFFSNFTFLEESKDFFQKRYFSLVDNQNLFLNKRIKFNFNTFNENSINYDNFDLVQNFFNLLLNKESNFSNENSLVLFDSINIFNKNIEKTYVSNDLINLYELNSDWFVKFNFTDFVQEKNIYNSSDNILLNLVNLNSNETKHTQLFFLNNQSIDFTTDLSNYFNTLNISF